MKLCDVLKVKNTLVKSVYYIMECTICSLVKFRICSLQESEQVYTISYSLTLCASC